MRKSLVILTTLVSLLNFTTQALGCVSSSYSQKYAAQYDIPSTYDLAIGKLPIHSNSYYNYIIQNNLEKIQKNQITLDEYDDLAVAYNKIGEKQKAIDLLLPIVKENPNRFSAVSNLGSIYLNMGDYENGLKYLRIANTLKPIDKYDREYAQEKVYSYLKERNKTPPYSFPIQDISSGKNFADFALKNIQLEKQNDEIIRLIFGIENMVRFGNHDSPVSMEVLGDLFLRFKENNNLYQYQLSENITGFYNAALIKSVDKHEEDLNKILQKNEEYNNKNSLEFMNEKFNKVKEDRKTLEEKEKEIILSNNDIEKTLNEDLISNDNTQTASIMQEKDRLYGILKSKENENIANKYLDYIGIMVIFSWIGLILSLINICYLVWERSKMLKRYVGLENQEFSLLNNLDKYLKKTFYCSLLLALSMWIIVAIMDFNVISFTLLLVFIFSSFVCMSCFLGSIYLITFGKYKSDNSYQLKLKTNMRKSLGLMVLSSIFLITSNISKYYVYEKYNYNTSEFHYKSLTGINNANLRNVE